VNQHLQLKNNYNLENFKAKQGLNTWETEKRKFVANHSNLSQISFTQKLTQETAQRRD